MIDDREVRAYFNNERKRLEIQQAWLSWGKFVCNLAEAETGMYLKVARQLVESGHAGTAQTMCFDRIADCGKRYSKLLTLTDMSGWNRTIE